MERQIKIPDIGSTQAVDVIEILVKPGQAVEIDTPLVTLESDKASMEIPSPEAGIIKSIALKLGDKVNQGDLILVLESAETTKPAEPSSVQQAEFKPELVAETIPASPVASIIEEIKIPDIGTNSAVAVIEIMVKVGDSIDENTSLITLESDKASMEIPSPNAGIIKSISVKVGDQVKQGDLILSLETQAQATATKPEKVLTAQPEKLLPATSPTRPLETLPTNTGTDILAGPAVRRLARTLGVNLHEVKGSGRKSRITLEDVEAYVKMRMQQPQAQTGANFMLPSAEPIDFSKFGEIEEKPLSKIKRISGQNLHKAWLQIPHVTQFDQADISDLEQFRKEQLPLLEKDGVKLTILAFICKAVTRALQEFPDFNSSLSVDGQNLILKKYIHIGIAVDTPTGLVVPVIKNADKLSIRELALKMAELSQKARQKALTPADMSGATFTISSLGGISGTAFTPIVNSPEVAILGVSKASIQPVYQAGEFVPRLMLPLSLSYDHRVIDGAQGARFTKYLADLLSDIRKVML